MSSSKDIIGIVKELKGRKCECYLCPRPPCIRCGLLTEHGDAIAQALLIAVEALEEIDNTIDGRPQGWWKTITSKALSRIRSL